MHKLVQNELVLVKTRVLFYTLTILHLKKVDNGFDEFALVTKKYKTVN